MKTYFFEGFLVAGSGNLSSIDKYPRDSDCVFCSEIYSPCCVDISLTPLTSPGFFQVKVTCASDLKNALRRLRSFLLIESFDFYCDFRYKCISNSGTSFRYFRGFERLLDSLRN